MSDKKQFKGLILAHSLRAGLVITAVEEWAQKYEEAGHFVSEVRKQRADKKWDWL